MSSIMKSIFLILVGLALVNNLNAQNAPTKIWDKTYGGSSSDYIHSIIATRDGGFILGGESYSPISGDKTQPNWNTNLSHADFWAVKTDASGNKQWDKRFGGMSADRIMVIHQTKEGGYIMGGTSYSNAGGDISESSRGDLDFWIVKTDQYGVKEWDKRFGGIGVEEMSDLQQSADGGYIVGGYSDSGISGDVSQQSRGTGDYWVVKIDSLGTKQWDKKFGTTNNDHFHSLIQTTDRGFIFGGTVAEGISGDKTQPLKGHDDIWIVRTDSLGNILWDRDYGAPFNYFDLTQLIALPNNGFIVAGNTYEPDTSDDKSQYKKGYWVLKADSNGFKIWDRTFTGGDFGYDYLCSAIATTDGGYLLGGETQGDTTIDKTEHNLGSSQSWVVKIDSRGNKQWDRTIFTYDTNATNSTIEGGAFCAQASDGGYGIARSSKASMGGYKTQSSKGEYDFLLVKMGDSILIGFNEKYADAFFSIYPNPTSREVTINLQKDNLKEADFTLTNTTGQVIYHSDETNLASTYTKMLDLGTLPAGIYILDISADGQKISRKILKE